MADFFIPEDEIEHERKYQIALEHFFQLMREKEIADKLLADYEKSNQEKYANNTDHKSQ